MFCIILICLNLKSSLYLNKLSKLALHLKPFKNFKRCLNRVSTQLFSPSFPYVVAIDA
jgi:hypothetical protein